MSLATYDNRRSFGRNTGRPILPYTASFPSVSAGLIAPKRKTNGNGHKAKETKRVKKVVAKKPTKKPNGTKHNKPKNGKKSNKKTVKPKKH